MNYDIVFGPSFKRGIRKLKKRFPSVKKDIALAVDILLENPELGVLIPGGSDVRKLRVRNSDMKRGKSGGYRLLYHFDDEGAASACYCFMPNPTRRISHRERFGNFWKN